MEDDYIGLHKMNRSLYNEKKTLSKILVDERKAHELDIITLAKAYRVRGKEHRARQNALSRRNKFEKRPAPIKILLLPTRNITSCCNIYPNITAIIGGARCLFSATVMSPDFPQSVRFESHPQRTFSTKNKLRTHSAPR